MADLGDLDNMEIENASDVTIAVLREHVNYLREMLDGKAAWYKEILDAERAENKRLHERLDTCEEELVQVKVALAGAVKSLDHASWNEPDRDKWRALLE